MPGKSAPASDDEVLHAPQIDQEGHATQVSAPFCSIGTVGHLTIHCSSPPSLLAWLLTHVYSRPMCTSLRVFVGSGLGAIDRGAEEPSYRAAELSLSRCRAAELPSCRATELPSLPSCQGADPGQPAARRPWALANDTHALPQHHQPPPSSLLSGPLSPSPSPSRCVAARLGDPVCRARRDMCCATGAPCLRILYFVNK